ncbi:MAG: tRNA uridine-5-carboxymethylaminomethyl(34) synthesis GTPase MnmE [Silvanigrellaceae bacterium]|nr:tRNA uridine-5-carboxymethylaminomethyl(34) synthesis GTPase MnmE [Silvanigrellaceae bacterium]
MLIFALATPNYRSAIHLHRVSGVGVFEALTPFLAFPKSRQPFSLQYLQWPTNASSQAKVFYLFLLDQQRELLDDAIVTFFKGPHSFTGEDTIEISLHGNPLLSAKLQSLLRAIGMRDAQPGEFTQRAYLQGKLDLVQAEGINQLIHSETLGGIEIARQAVEGLLSKEMLFLREKLIEILSYLEAHIDFSVDEVGSYTPASLLPILFEIQKRLTLLIDSYATGLKIRSGLKIALFGEPNAGKSSLYNALLRAEKAIVTDIPGTTRDVLESPLTIHGKDFLLLDTAGIRKSEDIVEKIGIERSLKALHEADILCYLIDASHIPMDEFEEATLKK